MSKQAAHSCYCDYILSLTQQDSFAGLDNCFVESCALLVDSPTASLYLGNSNSRSEEILLARYQVAKTKTQLEQPYLMAITLNSGQLLNLSLQRQPQACQTQELDNLIQVYINQHEHLSRSNKDSLTGLKNRRAFDLEYLELLEEVQQHHSQNFLAVADIDFFKKVNDEYGHVVGDETLISVAQIMKRYFKRDDFMYRFGGEEFVILLHDTSFQQATKLLDDLRQTFADYDFAQVGQKTLSLGYTELVRDGSAGMLFERADAALYYAKSNGRNCIMCYETLVDEKKIERIMHRQGDVDFF